MSRRKRETLADYTHAQTDAMIALCEAAMKTWTVEKCVDNTMGLTAFDVMVREAFNAQQMKFYAFARVDAHQPEVYVTPNTSEGKDGDMYVLTVDSDGESFIVDGTAHFAALRSALEYIFDSQRRHR